MSDVQLHLGDCLEFLRGMEPGSVDLVLTDPPFNVSKPDATRGKMRGAGRNAGKFYFGDWDRDFDPAIVCGHFARVMSGNGQAYLFTSSVLLPEWIAGLRHSFSWKVLTWAKPDPLPSLRQRHWVSATEHVLWFWRGRYRFNFAGHAEMYSWQMMQAPKHEARLHPNQKPLALVAKYILASTDPGDLILDPFMGSGTTGVACVQTGRRFIGCEISPEYFAIAKKRIAAAQREVVQEAAFFGQPTPDLFAEEA